MVDTVTGETNINDFFQAFANRQFSVWFSVTRLIIGIMNVTNNTNGSWKLTRRDNNFACWGE